MTGSQTKHESSVVDFEAVVAAVDTYVKGLRDGDVDQLKEAFDDGAVMYGLTQVGFLGGPIENLYTFIEEHGGAPEVIAHIDVLDITATTAVARVTMENDAMGDDFTDFHELVKLDGKWKIVGKVFHRHEK
ncbi:MAG: nuclear transport factor 2 family protein [Solirubrobacterales bacterium]